MLENQVLYKKILDFKEKQILYSINLCKEMRLSLQVKQNQVLEKEMCESRGSPHL